jgi:hypothetical protein
MYSLKGGHKKSSEQKITVWMAPIVYEDNPL